MGDLVRTCGNIQRQSYRCDERSLLVELSKLAITLYYAGIDPHVKDPDYQFLGKHVRRKQDIIDVD